MEEIGDSELKEEIDAILKHIDQTMKKIESVLPQKAVEHSEENASNEAQSEEKKM